MIKVIMKNCIEKGINMYNILTRIQNRRKKKKNISAHKKTKKQVNLKCMQLIKLVKIKKK